MNIRYICKKDLEINQDFNIKYGSVVQIEFVGKQASIMAVHEYNGTKMCHHNITDKELKEHFYIYDDMGSLDPVTALTYFIHKFSTMSKQGEMLKDLKYYINARREYFQTCNKEDIQQEQDTIQTLHTTNQ